MTDPFWKISVGAYFPVNNVFANTEYSYKCVSNDIGILHGHLHVLILGQLPLVEGYSLEENGIPTLRVL